jgi:hypothetical protein
MVESEMARSIVAHLIAISSLKHSRFRMPGIFRKFARKTRFRYCAA